MNGDRKVFSNNFIPTVSLDFVHHFTDAVSSPMGDFLTSVAFSSRINQIVIIKGSQCKGVGTKWWTRTGLYKNNRLQICRLKITNFVWDHFNFNSLALNHYDGSVRKVVVIGMA